MQLRSNGPQPVSTAAFFRELPRGAAPTASCSATTANALAFLSGNTRYRDQFLLAADPARVLIVAKFAECVGIAALVHSIGRFATRMACSAEAAVKLAGQFLPDIVLLTTELPDLASYRVASTLRWGSGRPVPRLIAMTNDIPAGDRDRALAAGFEQYLTAPVQRAALQSVLQHRYAGRVSPGRGAHKGN